MHDFLMWAGGIIISLFVTAIGGVLKMFHARLKEVESEHKALSKSLSAHKTHAAETFATKVDVDKGFDRVMNKLDSIDDKLDRKVDK